MARVDGGEVARVGIDALCAAVGLPVVGSLMATPIARSLMAEHRQRVSVALRAAVRVSGLGSWEDLTEQLQLDPRLQPLLVRLLHAAGTNGHDRTLRAMGAALGDAIRERDRIDECDLILQSLDGLTAAHTQLLELLNEPSPEGGAVWKVAEVEKAISMERTVYRLCRSSLYSRGLITEFTGFGSVVILELSETGKVVLEVLREHAHAEAG